MIVNPAGLYGGGAFKVDTTAATNYFLKQKAAEQAKEDTLDKYFRDLTSKATDKGMRDIDRPAFNQALQNYQNFYTQNKDKLAKSPELQLKAQQLAKLPFEIANSSIGEFNAANRVATVIATSEQGKDAFDEKTLGVNPDGTPYIDATTGKGTGLRAQGLPLYNIQPDGSLVENPDHVKFDVTQITRNPKLLSGDEFQKTINDGLKNIPKLITSKEIDIKGDPLNVTKVTTEQYDPNDPTVIKSVGDKLGNIYEYPSVRFTFKKNHPFKDYNEQTVAGFDAANKAFNTVYGRQIQPGNDKELFIGMNLSELITPKIKSETVVSEKKKMAAEEAKQIRVAKATAAINKTTEFIGKHPFESVDMNIPDKNLSIEGGVVYDAQGNRYTSPSNSFDVKVPLTSLDDRIKVQYAKGMDRGLLTDVNVLLQIENGKIKAIQGEPGSDVGTLTYDTFKKKGVEYEKATGKKTSKKTAELDDL